MTDVPCSLHRFHSPTTLVEADHHVVPQSWCIAAGVPIDPETVDICATGHENVHYAIDLLVEHKGIVPWLLWEHIGKAERDCATRGYQRAVALGLTPRPTL